MMPAKKINFDIEALRGFAAIFVVWHHAHLYSKLLAPDFTPTGVLNYGPSGHFCVLIFFILSGYVIGLSNKKRLNFKTSLIYLKKRFVRLYPIFIVTLMLALLFTVKSFSASTIVGNFLLVQGLFVTSINLPGWSLSYEVLYYVLFIFLSIFQINVYYCVIAAFLVGMANFALYPSFHTPIITSYCYGLIFWLLGLGMSRWLGAAKEEKSTYQTLVSCILLIMCVEQYNVMDTLLHKVTSLLRIYPIFPEGILWEQVAIHFYDLSYLPFAWIIVLIFVGKEVPYKAWLLRGLFGVAFINLIYVVKHVYAGDLDWNIYALPSIFFSASLFCLLVRTTWLERASQLVIQLGIRLGALSYGIYLVHFPFLFLFSRIKTYSATWTAFGVRFVLLLLLTLIISYWLEKVMQPRIKAYFFKGNIILSAEPSTIHN